MTPVSVGEWMNCNQTVVESRRQFIGRIPVVLNPCPGVVDEQTNGRRDFARVVTDIRLGSPILAGPCPDLAEHCPMQVAQVLVVEES